MVSTHVIVVKSEPMIDPGRHDHEIILLKRNSDPVVVLVPNVEVSAAVQHVPNLLILMDMLIEEHLQLRFVDIAHFLF